MIFWIMQAKTIFTLLFLLIGITFGTRAQATAFADIFATVVAPEVKVKVNDLVVLENINMMINNGSQENSHHNTGINGSLVRSTLNISGGTLLTFDLSFPTDNIVPENGMKSAMSISKIQQTIKDSPTGVKEVRLDATFFVSDNFTENHGSLNLFPIILHYN